MKQDTDFGILTGSNIEAQFLKAGSVIFREGDEAKRAFCDQKRTSSDSDRQPDGDGAGRG
ncbi:hypothetical protein [Bradyrhizobium sp.]|uniref:hypothetical protein n=1 Tax=Bradyrhizobium sp. TaxID=376 RepID=UPI003C392873